MSNELVVPFAQGPEKSVLSSILKNDNILAKARAEGLTDEHFYQPGLKILFRRLMARNAAGQSNELVGLIHDLQEHGELDAAGGPSAISEIYTYAPNSAHFVDHLQVLRRSLAKRRAQAGALQVLEKVDELSADDLTDALRSAAEVATAALSDDSGVMTAKQAVEALSAQMREASEGKEFPGLPTSLDPIDLVTGGMRPGEFWVVAALPSEGKSVVMIQAAVNALRLGKRVLVISLEMGAAVVMARLLSCMHSIPMRAFTHPRNATKIDLIKAKRAVEAITEDPLAIHDRGGLTAEQIAAVAQCEADRHGGIDLLIVDYLQLIEGSGKRRQETREQEVAAISRSLKALAKKLHIPVFSASQLNDQGKMRESRAIGQDADVVLRIEENGILGMKVRNGVRGQLFPLRLNGELQRFESFNPN